MRKITSILLVICFLMVAVSFNVFSKQVEIKIWHMEQPPHRVKVFQNVIDEFNKQNPDIYVKQQVLDWMNAYQKTIAAIQARQAPEILFTLPDFTTVIKQTGVVQPVDDLFNKLDKKYDFIDAAVNPYTYDGHTWAIPTYGMVHMMWYRKDLFEKAGLDPDNPPQTWDELLEAVKKLEENGITGIGVPASHHMYTDQAIYSFMIAGGAHEIFNEDGEIVFNNPKTIKTFKFYNQLVNHSPQDCTGWSWAEPQLAFNNGTIAIAIEKGQFLGPFEEESGVDGSNLGGAPVPYPEDGQRGSIYYPNGMMILTKDKEKLAAVEKFLNYLYEPEINGKWLAMEPGLFLPVTNATLNSESFWSNPIVDKYKDLVKLMIEQSKYGRLFGFNHQTVNQNIGKIAGQHILAQTVQKMVVKGLSPEEAIKWGEEKMKEAIK
ncbi:MAG: multiple sugar transport system substrate-binding protein [Halanaerobiales bacterium]|nr:multiple sugar transport system substrate-binding protein [Halanaerobiales bacterium]